MKNSLKHFCCFLFFLSLFQLSAFSQQNSMTEEEMKIQGMFIEANKFKILENFEKAEDILKKLLELAPDNHVAMYELARVMEAQDKDGDAKRYIIDALELDDSNDWYHIFYADLEDKMGRPVKAAEIYKELVKRNDENDYYLLKQAYYHVLGKEPDKAIKVYDDFEERVGVSPDISQKKHKLYLTIGKEKEAAEELQKLIDAYPSNSEYYYDLADFYTAMGKKSDAKKVYEDLQVIDPDNVKARMALEEDWVVNKGAEEGDVERIQKLFRDETVDIDTKIKTILPLANEIANSNNQATAKAYLPALKTLTQVHPDEAKSFAIYADMLYYAGDKEEATRKYEKALSIDKSVYAVWEQLLFIYSELGDYKRLAELSYEALDYFPNNPIIFFFNGMANCEIQEYSVAQPSLEQAKLMAVNNKLLKIDVLNRLGEAYFALGKADKGADNFEKALELDARAAIPMANYAYYLSSDDQSIEKAEKLAREAQKINAGHPATNEAMGKVSFEKNDFSKAKEWYGKAIANGGDVHPRILEGYGDTLFKLSLIDEAVNFWKKARSKGIDNTRLKNKIENRKLIE